MGKFLLVIIVFAALVYACFYLLERRRAYRSSNRPAGRPPAPRPRTVAPDDDEDFLRDLRRRNRENGERPGD